MQKTIDAIKADVPEFGSIPFWSWNDKLEPEHLRRQMRDMKKLGMGGAFMHARAGLETEYLSDEWFECINACVDEAEKLGMQAWAYDENGWPSGFGGGALLGDKKNLSISVEYKFGTFADTDDDTIAVYKKNADGSFTLVTADGGEKEYLILYKKYDTVYVDTLNREVTEKFIACTHEEYKRRIPADKFGTGKPMPGFFTDEPQYNRDGNPYSDILPDEFRRAYGYEVTDALPAIFFDYPATDGHYSSDKHRYDYYYLIHKLFTNNFIKPIYDWCVENGVELTGHAVEETSLTTQMWCCGGVMPFYQYETIPGIDYLGRPVKNDLAHKQLGSVVAQLGKKKALSEMFACCGWDVNPTELKKIADVQYVSGINLMCQHLYPVSERGQRKRDYPQHYSEHNPWHDAFGDFNRYYSNLGAVLSQGREYAPVLVVHPMHSAYCRFKMREWNIVDLESKFIELVDLLGENQVPYHFGDEWMMQSLAHVEGNRIIVGKCEYEAILLPYLYSLDTGTVDLLREFVKNGGKVCLYDGKPIYVDGLPCGDKLDFLTPTASLDDIFAYRDVTVTFDGEGVKTIRKMTRITDEGKIVYITNVSDARYCPVRVSLPADGAKWAELDNATLRLKPVYVKDGAAYLRFNDAESHILVTVTDEEYDALPAAEMPTTTKDYIRVPAEVKLVGKHKNVLTLDYASRSNDGVHYDDPQFLMGIKDNLLRERYAGKVWLKFTYCVDESFVPTDLCVAVEPMYEHVFVNGTEVFPDTSKWWFDRHIGTAQIAHLTHGGMNEIVIEVNHYQRDYVYHVLYDGVAEAARNCLLFDTEIENIYLVGDFGVGTDGRFTDGDKPNSVLYEGGFVLTNTPESVPADDVVRGGFPFFSGTINVEFEYDYTAGMPTVLLTDGRHAATSVSVNGEKVRSHIFGSETKLADYLKEGKNIIGVSITNSMRNTLGPHHRRDVEPIYIGPPTFSWEKEWKGRECADFYDRYAFIRFGV